MGPDLPAGPQFDGPLAVREEEGAVFVVREDDPEDWLARFEKGGGFPARAWAENMVEVYNRRLQGRGLDPGPLPRTSPESA